MPEDTWKQYSWDFLNIEVDHGERNKSKGRISGSRRKSKFLVLKKMMTMFQQSFAKVADFSPKNIFGNTATDGTKPDLNIGFQGLALIQGQIYNPDLEWKFLTKIQLGKMSNLGILRVFGRLGSQGIARIFFFNNH